MKAIILIFTIIYFLNNCRGETIITFNDPQIQKNISEKLGEQHYMVLHAVTPFDFGWEKGSRADVYLYKKHIDGIVYITGDLIGKKQFPSDAGNYELMICHKIETEWGSDIISNLAYYTLEASINSGETMDLGGRFMSNDSKIVALIFDKYSEFMVNGKKYGLMLLIGITKDELEYKIKNGGKELIKKLKENNVYPYTDLSRDSLFN